LGENDTTAVNPLGTALVQFDPCSARNQINAVSNSSRMRQVM
jgi:hypothetical protein